MLTLKNRKGGRKEGTIVGKIDDNVVILPTNREIRGNGPKSRPLKRKGGQNGSKKERNYFCQRYIYVRSVRKA